MVRRLRNLLKRFLLIFKPEPKEFTYEEFIKLESKLFPRKTYSR